MPSFNTEVSHSLGKEQARQRLESFLDRAAQVYKDQIGELTGEWSGDTLNFKMTTYGIAINGNLAVEEETVRIQGQLPFAAVAFRGKIEKGFAKEIERALR
jgi:putative polyhydroxyalkanoate system protein